MSHAGGVAWAREQGQGSGSGSGYHLGTCPSYRQLCSIFVQIVVTLNGGAQTGPPPKLKILHVAVTLNLTLTNLTNYQILKPNFLPPIYL